MSKGTGQPLERNHTVRDLVAAVAENVRCRGPQAHRESNHRYNMHRWPGDRFAEVPVIIEISIEISLSYLY
jgi:hypothetical protein